LKWDLEDSGDQKSSTMNKHHPQQFKDDAVALYRSRPGATITSVADDLGVNRETVRSWVRAERQAAR
jgi:transposase